MQKSPSSARVGRTTARLFVIATIAVCAHAWASGWPPFTRNDSATVIQGGDVDILNNGARSVLANDFDFERDPLEAILTRDVRHGELDLDEDGTFEYEHDGGNANSDFFEYRAWDGTGFSRSTRVTITIEAAPNSPPFVVSEVPDQSAVEGVDFDFNTV